MAKSNEARNVVKKYFSAWTSNRVDEAYACLADRLEFAGPNATYKSAAEFKPALAIFAAMTKGARVIELLADGDRVALLYDCDLPEPVGTLRIASFFRVEKGRIRAYDTRFDSTNFAKLARKAAGK